MRNFKTHRPKARSYYQDDHYTGELKAPSSEGSVNNYISEQSLRKLPKSSFSMKADPYTNASNPSAKYGFLAPFNKTVGGTYSGEDNIDGGNIQQYSNSVTSDFLQYFDCMRMKIGVNYLNIPARPIANKIGYGLIDEMRNCMAEALSALQASTFTALAINSFGIITDLPMGSAVKSTVSDKRPNAADKATVEVYDSITDVLFGMSMYYQIFLQEGISTVSSFNSFRLKQGVAIRNAWDREVPNLNALFGLFNKKAFLNLIEGICMSFQGEYVDKRHTQQINTLSFMPSRRSNSYTDPILEIEAIHSHPSKFQVVLLNDTGEVIRTIFDDSMLMVNGISYWDACLSIKDYLSLEATTYWARQLYAEGAVATIAGYDNDRYNTVKSLFDVITYSFNRFKPLWADYRECLDIMTRTGVVGWSKGFRPQITQDTTADIFSNLIVDDIYKMVISGPNTIQFNDTTKRWTTYSQWNMYSGVPQYDMKQGGCFITFSSKDFSGAAVGTETLPYLPIMFDPVPGANQVYIYAVNRSGVEATIGYEIKDIRSDIKLRRLAPLASQAGITIRVPYVTNLASLEDAAKSTLTKTLTQIFGFCDISGICMDPDLICIYQIEISDITNASKAFARSYGPFRGTTDAAGANIGFSALGV